MKAQTGSHYDLTKVQALVREAKFLTTMRVRSYLLNHGYDPNETVKDVVCAIQPHHFHKSSELDKRPGVFADIYRHVECYETEWYVKIFLDDDENPRVSIWSLKEEGFQF